MNHNLDPKESTIYKYVHLGCGSGNLKFLKLQKRKDIVFFHCNSCAKNFQTPFKGGHLLSAEDNLRSVYP